MSRYRRPNHTSLRIDEGTRPPAACLPRVFVDLLSEYDRINAEHRAAESAVNRFRDDWDAQLAAAKAEDARENALTARQGSLNSASTTHADELVRARARALDLLASLSDAKRLVSNDVYQLLADEQSNPAYEDAVQTARAALVKAAAPLQAAITRAVQARAVQEWIHGHPWDSLEAVHVRDLSTAVAASYGAGLDTLPPTSAAHLITVLTQIAD